MENSHSGQRLYPGTNHRAVIALINVKPPTHMAHQRLIFLTRDDNRPKPRIKYRQIREAQV